MERVLCFFAIMHLLHGQRVAMHARFLCRGRRPRRPAVLHKTALILNDARDAEGSVPYRGLPYLNNPSASAILAITGTPKGQRSSQCPQAMHPPLLPTRLA